jgi:hypothetical protein
LVFLETVQHIYVRFPISPTHILRIGDTLKMYPWMLTILILYYMIYAWFVRFPSWFTLIYRDLQQRVISLVFNVPLQENHVLLVFEFQECFACFWVLGTLGRSNGSTIFFHVIFMGIIRIWAKEMVKRKLGQEIGRRRGYPWSPRGPTLALVYPFALVSTKSDELSSKTNYIYDLVVKSQAGGRQ